MHAYAQEILTRLDYSSSFTNNEIKSKSSFIDDFNLKSLENSIKMLESDEITSIFINYPQLLLRKKSLLYPEGRTSYRFKKALRRKVTIIDKNKKDDI